MDMMHLLIWGNKQNNISPVLFLPKTHNVNLIKRKHQTNIDWGTFYQITNLYSLKNIKVFKNKDRLRNCSRILVTKQTWKLNAACILDWISDQKEVFFFLICSKSYYWDNWQNLSKICRFAIKTVLNNTFPILIMAL